MEDRFNTPQMSSFEIEVLGHKLFLSQDPNSKHLGTTVWDSSLVFAKFMERNSKKGEFSRAKMNGKRVIELGAGCGLAGIGMALLGCNVVVTDQVAVLPILLRNVERNLSRAKYTASENLYLGSIGNVEVAELDWGKEEHIAAVEPPFDYIIGTDVVYVEHLLEPLMATILALAGPKTTVLLGYEFRSSGVREQLHELCKKHFLVKKVLHSKMDPKYQHPNIDLFILRRIDTSTRSTLDSSEGHCQLEEVGRSPPEQSKGTRENSAESSSLCSKKVGNIPVATCLENQDGKVPASTADELSSDEEGFCESIRPSNLGKKGPRSPKVSSLGRTRHDKAGNQPNDWEVRRLGSSVARLLSEVSLPSA